VTSLTGWPVSNAKVAALAAAAAQEPVVYPVRSPPLLMVCLL
jgi:hypothetical protein